MGRGHKSTGHGSMRHELRVMGQLITGHESLIKWVGAPQIRRVAWVAALWVETRDQLTRQR